MFGGGGGFGGFGQNNQNNNNNQQQGAGLFGAGNTSNGEYSGSQSRAQ